MLLSVGVLPYFYAMLYLFMYFSCNKMPTRASGMSLGESVTVCFGIPVLPADLPPLSPGYRSPARLGNHPLRPLAYAVCAP